MEKFETPDGTVLSIPEEYWNELEKADLKKTCDRVEAVYKPDLGIVIRFLSYDVLVNIKNRGMFIGRNGQWEPVKSSLVGLMSIVYLLNARAVPLQDKMVSPQELKSSHFFQGPHELKIGPVLDKYRKDIEGFKKSAQNLEGRAVDMADAAFALFPFPKIPMYYLLWADDDEFPAHLSVLFDRSIEDHLAPDAIWGIVNIVSDMLLKA